MGLEVSTAVAFVVICYVKNDACLTVRYFEFSDVPARLFIILGGQGNYVVDVAQSLTLSKGEQTNIEEVG